MDWEMKKLPDIAILGKAGFCTAEDNRAPSLWAEANAHFSEVASLGMREPDGSLVVFWGAMSDETMSFLPWTEGFSRGFYLAGIEIYRDTPVPAGWTKWVLPARTYLKTEVNPQYYMAVFREVLEQVLPKNNLRLCGAACDYTQPATGKSYLLFPVEAVRASLTESII